MLLLLSDVTLEENVFLRQFLRISRCGWDEERVLGAQKREDATKTGPKTDPLAEFLVFEQVLKQRLRRDLPRGFILVLSRPKSDTLGNAMFVST